MVKIISLILFQNILHKLEHGSIAGIEFFNGQAPFKNVAVSEQFLQVMAQKMSKSKNNYTDPNVLFDTFGGCSEIYFNVLQLMRALDLNFLDDNVKEIHKNNDDSLKR